MTRLKIQDQFSPHKIKWSREPVKNKVNVVMHA